MLMRDLTLQSHLLRWSTIALKYAANLVLNLSMGGPPLRDIQTRNHLSILQTEEFAPSLLLPPFQHRGVLISSVMEGPSDVC